MTRSRRKLIHNADASIQCSIPCDLCGSTEVDELCLVDNSGSYLRTVICRRCGLVYSDPRPRSEQVRDYYEHSYRMDYKATLQPKPKHVYRAGKVAIDRFRRLATILKPGHRVLDFGAGSGEVVFVLRAMGYEVCGFEPNKGYAGFASEVLGLPISHGFYRDTRIESASQDIVTAFHVVEHLESPYNALRHVRDWLRPDGRLLVEVPNVEAVCQWPRSRFHRSHLYNFSPATLEMVGKKVGYTVDSSSVSSDGGNITVVFRKDSTSTQATGEIPGNYERISSIVRRHTFFRHLLTPYPYVRPFYKIAARIQEQRATRKKMSPREILDDLIATELRHK
jgi:2-polyprenyl-3-methyl-5-hydroxy-6-metoxy-1,4-benzoquinol methylase